MLHENDRGGLARNAMIPPDLSKTGNSNPYNSMILPLVIGNSAYRNVVQLTNPANDAKLISDAHRHLTFD
jgi:hypothetical protein